MLRRLWIGHIALAATLTFAGCATMEQSTARGNQGFKNADSDGNGILSQDEIIQHLDANGDGGLSLEEWNKLMLPED